MKKYAIIVAGGSGTRMKSELPKQFLPLAGKPVLMRTIEAFYNCDKQINIILVLPTQHEALWKSLVINHKFKVPHIIAQGGNTRNESVKNGLKTISGDGLVAIHDGARPLVSSSIIKATYDQALINGNAIAAVAIKDSIRHISRTSSQSVNRDEYRAVQTPQTFKLSLIKKAFENANPEKDYADDASVLEDSGEKINLTEGSYENIKITTPEDLIIAESVLKSRK